ncbi:amidase [Undibacterium terreum]|uniref:Amidase n=1 Tax=Undibacterium terreum TaxID=1224302 RepID=A0A916U8Z8_9BURK|nr:amidase [Undibacterium terreum]GGC62453.1 amidase [Undibacterium terreum]
MDRRDFMKLGAIAGAAGAGGVVAGEALAMPVNAAEAAKAASIVEASVSDLQAAMSAGKLTSKALVTQYLARIKSIDRAGPHINSIIELNPDALSIADALDKERKAKGPRGPLHGIPVLLKDNIATADKMQTTAGSLALVGAKAPRDAFLVSRLREAGAVILGKTNLSEWANIRSTRSTSGWSARGGQTKNPYALDRNTSGSSSGSGAAIAASLAAIAVGTETDGSITSPASICGLVGIKPTLGLVSRDGIIPIAHSQDTAGPMTRTVTDAALMLTAMAGVDQRDAATAGSSGKAADYSKFLDADGLKGARIGVARNAMGGNLRLQPAVDAALEVMKAKGAILIDVEVPNMNKYGDSELEVLLYELKADLNRYLAEFGTGAPVQTLKDVIAFNEKHRDKEMPYFDQELFIRAEAKGGLDSKEYLDALANNHKYSRAEGLDKVIADNKLDALFALTGGPAWLTDYVNGDHSGDGFSSPAAVAGYPHITVPAGFVAGLPVGVSFVAGAYAEATLIKLAYAFEQATRHRRAPAFKARADVGSQL